MPDYNIASGVIAVLFLGVGLLAAARFLLKQAAPVKTARAVVVDKHIVETFSKYSGNGRHTAYAVVFSVEGKQKTFYVPQFSYHGYRIHETGTLTYRGDKLISFR